MTLDALFGGTKPSCPWTIEVDEEEALQQVTTKAREDERLDDGAIEIGSDNEWW